jgi:hypothetical protein
MEIRMKGIELWSNRFPKSVIFLKYLHEASKIDIFSYFHPIFFFFFIVTNRKF